MRFLKKVWIIVAVLIISFAVFSSIFRSLTPWMKQYKGEVEHYLTQVTGQPVAIQKIETGWYWFHPVLKLHQVKVGSDEKNSLNLGHFYIGINIFKSLWTWRIQPGIFYLEDLHLVLRQNKGQWLTEGVPTQSKESNRENTTAVLAWILQQERLILKKVSLLFYMEDGALIPLHDLNLSVVNQGGYFKIKGDAEVKQTNPSSLQLLGNLRFDLNQLEKTEGHFYIAGKNIVLTQWQGFVPKRARLLEGGTGNLALWLDLKKGLISAVQAQGHLSHLAWHMPNQNKEQRIQDVEANLSWAPKSKGWQLEADHIQLRIGGVSWPENKLSLKYDKQQGLYQFFIQEILLESLLAQDLPWPAFLQKILQLKPQGLLSNTQLFIKEQQPSYFLTAFKGLGWEAQGSIPQVRQLSGVLNWQPEEGRLELDSEQVLVHEPGYPPLKFNVLNGAIDWKELSQGLGLSIEHFVLSQSDLTLTAEGAMDKVTQNSFGHVRLTSKFSAKNLEQFKAFLPKNLMKVKLYEWLVHDLKGVAQTSGKLELNGLAEDFPFDQTPGVFSIKTHVQGGAFQVNSEWPVIKEVEADLKLNNRDLNIDILHADMQGVPVKQVNVRIDDIGHDKENLLVHGLFEGKAQKMMDYVLATPLKNKLNILKLLAMKGSTLMNLAIELPLYPENEDILVKGELRFDNNTIQVKHPFKVIELINTSGRLDFDENGIRQSNLAAHAFGSPMNIHILSEKKPKPITSIEVRGALMINELKKQFPEAYFTSLKGSFPIKALIKLSHETEDIESISMNSTLKGLKIDLPQPLGKKAQEIAQTEAEFDFTTKDILLMKARFQDIVLNAKKHSDPLWSFQIEQKNLTADLNYNQETRVLSGVIKRLHLDKAVFLKDQEWQSSLSPGQIPNLNLRIEECSLGSINLGAVTLKSHSTPEHFYLDQCKIEAPVYQFDIDGTWTQTAKKNKTELALKLYLKNLEKGLERWELSPLLDADKGVLEFHGSWKDSIYRFSLASLSGRLSLQLTHGRITHLSPETEGKLGLGKLLSILSLQTIPRRLQLDFSDLSHQGYSFDTLKGSFIIDQGIMHTEDSYIDGPVAYGSVKGNLDLVKQMFDLDLSISPHITASLPLVATIAGGPLAGVAVWVANSLINQSMQKISAYTYKVSGPWKEPVVQQLTIVKKKQSAPRPPERSARE